MAAQPLQEQWTPSSYISTWLGFQKPISNPTVHQITTGEASSSSTPMVLSRGGQLDNIANGVCIKPNSERKTSADTQSSSDTSSTDDGRIPDWKQAMIAKNEAAKKEVADIMDDSLKRVIAKIENKPSAQRDSGASSYTSSVDWIMWSVKSIINRVK